MKRYFRYEWESYLGPGTFFIEFTDDEPTRQAECYSGRWFSSRDQYHEELGPGLASEPLTDEQADEMDEISAEEFEQAWTEAGS